MNTILALTIRSCCKLWLPFIISVCISDLHQQVFLELVQHKRPRSVCNHPLCLVLPSPSRRNASQIILAQSLKQPWRCWCGSLYLGWTSCCLCRTLRRCIVISCSFHLLFYFLFIFRGWGVNFISFSGKLAFLWTMWSLTFSLSVAFKLAGKQTKCLIREELWLSSRLSASPCARRQGLSCLHHWPTDWFKGGPSGHRCSADTLPNALLHPLGSLRNESASQLFKNSTWEDWNVSECSLVMFCVIRFFLFCLSWRSSSARGRPSSMTACSPFSRQRTWRQCWSTTEGLGTSKRKVSKAFKTVSRRRVFVCQCLVSEKGISLAFKNCEIVRESRERNKDVLDQCPGQCVCLTQLSPKNQRYQSLLYNWCNMRVI